MTSIRLKNSGAGCTFFLSKVERLSGRSIISTLFSTGSSHRIGCIQLVHMENQEAKVPQILFSVSKSRIAKAYMRNAIKRKMREAYRLNKRAIYDPSALKIAVGFVYVKNMNLSFLTIKNDIVAHLEWLKEHYKSIEDLKYRGKIL
jgi:ribonuclease P protein component